MARQGTSQVPALLGDAPPDARHVPAGLQWTLFKPARATRSGKRLAAPQPLRSESSTTESDSSDGERTEPSDGSAVQRPPSKEGLLHSRVSQSRASSPSVVVPSPAEVIEPAIVDVVGPRTRARMARAKSVQPALSAARSVSAAVLDHPPRELPVVGIEKIRTRQQRITAQSKSQTTLSGVLPPREEDPQTSAALEQPSRVTTSPSAPRTTTVANPQWLPFADYAHVAVVDERWTTVDSESRLSFKRPPISEVARYIAHRRSFASAAEEHLGRVLVDSLVESRRQVLRAVAQA